MRAKEPATREVILRRARQKRYYERKKLSLKKEEIERRRIVKEERAARLAQRGKLQEAPRASLPATRTDKTVEWNAGFTSCYLSMQPNIEALKAEMRKLKAQINAGV